MTDPYRDETAAMCARLDSLLDELDRRRARASELERLTQDVLDLEAEIEGIRRKIHAQVSTEAPSLLDQITIASLAPRDGGRWQGTIRSGDAPDASAMSTTCLR